MNSTNKQDQLLPAKVIFDRMVASAARIENFKSYMMLTSFVGEQGETRREETECLTQIDVTRQTMLLFLQKQREMSRIYMEQDTAFAMTPELQAWVKLPAEALDQLFQKQNPFDPLREVAPLRAFAEDFAVEADDQGWQLSFSKHNMPLDAVQEQYHFLFSPGDVLMQFDCFLSINRETHFLMEQEFAFITRHESGKNAIIGLKLVYSDHNELAPISRPAALEDYPSA